MPRHPVQIIALAVGIAFLTAPSLLLGVLLAQPTLDALWMYFDLHFWTTGVTALAAAVACAVVIASARTLRETRLLFLALAFMSIAGIFSVHGLLTPGVIKHEFFAAIAVSAWISVFAGGVFAALSAADLPSRLDRAVSRGGIMIFAWTCMAIGLFVAISWTVESWLDNMPTDERGVQYAMAFAAMGLYAFAAWRYLQSWFFARLPAQLATAGALVLLLQIPPILLWGEPWYASWWTYHATYAAAFAVLFTGWVIEWRRAGSLDAIAESLSMRDALAQLSRGHDRNVVELVDAIEAKDYYTVGHVHRVGSMAYEVAKQLGLSPAQQREVVLASQMHDVGKIWTPEAILLKPAALTDDEAAIMREHAWRGGDMAGRVPVLSGVSAAVRAHHEHYDGRGYPDGLSGDDIPLAARICAVADAYDAMTSTRPYRKALPHDAAISELRRVRGTQLDPACVDAFLAAFEARGQRAA